KIGIERDQIEYLSRGEVKGYLLNQDSLSEDENENLRIATTTEFYSKDAGSILYNNLYIMDSQSKVIGKLERIDINGRVNSYIFMEDKLYMVEDGVDEPLFAIDLSNANNPTVIGELNIAGSFSYLHLYDKTHLIRIG